MALSAVNPITYSQQNSVEAASSTSCKTEKVRVRFNMHFGDDHDAQTQETALLTNPMHRAASSQLHLPSPRQYTSPTCCSSLFWGLNIQNPFKRTSEPKRTTKAPTPLLVQPFQTQQHFEGWGTSLCWFANIVGGFPEKTRDEITDLIFDHKVGLGMEICRYNIGGSGRGNKDTGNFRYGADLPSFWGPDGEWDWSVDKNQRWVLLEARKRGACIFEAFSNSPPFWMTYSGRASGNRFAWLDNLPPERYDDFVHYLTEVVRWYKEEHNLIFRTVDPFNEPSSNYWWAGNNQEGCHFGSSSQNAILPKLRASIEKAGLTEAGVGISASDETSIDLACQSVYNYSSDSLKSISQINSHCYQGSRRAELRDLAASAGKRLWMSEVGFGNHAPDDVWAAMDVSKCILADLNVMQVNAWVYWQACENCDTQPSWWGLIQTPYHRPGEEVLVGKQFYGMLQYTKFIKNGWTILGTNHADTTLAAISPAHSKTQAVVIVITNFDSNDREETIDLTAFKGNGRAHVHRTSQTENFEKVEHPALEDAKIFNFVAKAVSISTLYIEVESVTELVLPNL